MGSPRKFRFGTTIQATSRAELIDQVHRAEELGYSSVAVTDHVSAPRLAPIATLAAMAALDTSLRLQSIVLGNDFRHPAFLASEAATIDLISEGRLELGIGTGWVGSDYAQTGLTFDPPGIRVSRLIEAIRVIKALFADEPVTFAGEYYNIQGLNLMPKPVQRPHPPLLIGGGGKRMLTLAAQEANIVSINTVTRAGTMDMQTFRSDVFAQQVSWVHAAAGARLAEIELHCMLFGIAVTDNQQAAAEEWIKMMEHYFQRPTGLSVDDVLTSPYVLIGTVDQMIETLEMRRARYGLSYFIPGSFINMDVLAPVVKQLAGK